MILTLDRPWSNAFAAIYLELLNLTSCSPPSHTSALYPIRPAQTHTACNSERGPSFSTVAVVNGQRARRVTVRSHRGRNTRSFGAAVASNDHDDALKRVRTVREPGFCRSEQDTRSITSTCLANTQKHDHRQEGAGSVVEAIRTGAKLCRPQTAVQGPWVVALACQGARRSQCLQDAWSVETCTGPKGCVASKGKRSFGKQHGFFADQEGLLPAESAQGKHIKRAPILERKAASNDRSFQQTRPERCFCRCVQDACAHTAWQGKVDEPPEQLRHSSRQRRTSRSNQSAHGRDHGCRDGSFVAKGRQRHGAGH